MQTDSTSRRIPTKEPKEETNQDPHDPCCDLRGCTQGETAIR